MRILVAIDSFKGSIGSYPAGQAVADALYCALPEAFITQMGIADGGEGSLEVFCREGGAAEVRYPVMGPLDAMEVSAGHAWRASDRTAMVEMAMASGLALMGPRPLNALEATTFGTGQCLLQAAAMKPDRLVLAVGGSATTDGGTGAARALGWRFLDAAGQDIGLGGGELLKLAWIEAPPTLDMPPVEVLCDVDNPLLGPEGSAAVYGPQKGASLEEVQLLDDGLGHLHDLVQQQFDINMNIPGGGAAGGLAAGALAFFNGQLKPGIETLMELAGLDERLDGLDWLITGEGSLDHQSLRGKVIAGLLAKCKTRGIRVGVIAGQVKLSETELQKEGIQWALPLMKPGISHDYAMTHTEALLKERATEAAQLMCSA